MQKKPFAVRVLHWAVTGLFVVAVPTGYRLADTGWSGTGLLDRHTIYDLHQKGGALIAILLLVWGLLRGLGLLRRGKGGVRTGAESVWWNRTVIASHAALAGLAMAVAGLGWIGSVWAAGNRAGFDIISIPSLFISISPGDVVTLYALHKALVPYFLTLLALHVTAVAFHALVLRDQILGSMLFHMEKGRNGPGFRD